MYSPTNVIEFPQLDTTDDDGPRFYAWRWARGAITVTIMGLDDLTDGETMLTFTAEVGVEMGQSKVLALSGEPTMLHFKGIFADHCATVFSRWNKLADENDRPDIFEDEGLSGLARLPKLAEPPLPPDRRRADCDLQRGHATVGRADRDCRQAEGFDVGRLCKDRRSGGS